jgi:hypothetical protein
VGVGARRGVAVLATEAWPSCLARVAQLVATMSLQRRPDHARLTAQRWGVFRRRARSPVGRVGRSVLLPLVTSSSTGWVSRPASGSRERLNDGRMSGRLARSLYVRGDVIPGPSEGFGPSRWIAGTVCPRIVLRPLQRIGPAVRTGVVLAAPYDPARPACRSSRRHHLRGGPQSQQRPYHLMTTKREKSCWMEVARPERVPGARPVVRPSARTVRPFRLCIYRRQHSPHLPPPEATTWIWGSRRRLLWRPLLEGGGKVGQNAI